MADSIVVFYIALFILAFLYASVGHGGASGYLALMAIYGISPDVMKPTALLLNLFVSVVSFIQFYRGGHFKMNLFWPLALGSVPFAFIGGSIHMDASIYKIILGFLSGLIGIGGGIILSPILLLLGWSNMKQTAAISALFIFVNSLAGLMGQLSKGIQFNPDMYTYVAVAFVGGLCGAYLGSIKFSQNVLKYALAVVLALAAYKLLFTAA